MATRFHFANFGAAAVNPSFDAGWEQNGQATRLRLVNSKQASTINAQANSSAVTVPITTTQDILCYQFVSDSFLTPIIWEGTCSGVIRVFENANTNNVTLAAVVSICAADGTNVRQLFSTFNTGTEFPLSASAATRIIPSGSALTRTVGLAGDRLIVELGGHAAAPTAAGSYTMRIGNAGGGDFALTAGLTTDLNPWVELSLNIHDDRFNDYMFARAGDGISVTEKIR